MSRRGPRSFDPVAVGNRETDAWAAHYRHELGTLLVAAVAMVWIGFGLGPSRTLLGPPIPVRSGEHWSPSALRDAVAEGAR